MWILQIIIVRLCRQLRFDIIFVTNHSLQSIELINVDSISALIGPIFAIEGNWSRFKNK